MRFLSLLFALLFWCGAVDATPKFPALTGRVVDDAHILSDDTVNQLTQMLADYENATGNQIVVVTLETLQDYDIADYGYQLGRTWGIGQKDKNNGALLIVAPNERKVRIEVGYGLEGDLTDASVSVIIHQVILPEFKNGNMEHGIVAGTEAIIKVIGGETIQPIGAESTSPILTIIVFLFLCFIARAFFGNSYYGSGRFSGISFGSSSGFGGSSGGFSGGGGSFGGGGGSGSW